MFGDADRESYGTGERFVFVRKVICVKERSKEMSLELINNIFSKITENENWSVQLLGFKHSKRNGTSYNCRRIELEPQQKTQNIIEEISQLYIGTNGRLSKYSDVREYDGTCNGTTIYRISEDNENVIIDIESLLQGIADSDVESDPLDMKAQAYVLSNEITIAGEEHRIKLISMNNPIVTLKNRFYHKNDKFWEISNKVLNLRTIINVVIYDSTVYFLDMSGETLFNMERAYKIKCGETVEMIESMDIVSDIVVFKNTATTGQNPRKFVAFSKSKLDKLSKKKNRKKAAEYFKIPVVGDDCQFDTSKRENADNLVKVLCNKAMWDILEEMPVEVDGSKNWKV